MVELDKLSEQLTVYYSKEGGWEFLKDNHPLWMKIHEDLFAPKHLVRQPEGGQKPFRKHAPPPLDPRGFGQRIILLDTDKHPVIGGGGPPGSKPELITQPIYFQSHIIGYLGIIPVTELSRSGDLRFVEQQTEAFAVITITMVAVSLLLTFPLTVHLLRPINHLTEGTQKLIGGQFTNRIPVTTGDELGRLSEHFNILALTLEENEKARRRWIADISHELRTPLAVLRGEVEALQDGVRKMEPRTVDPLHGEILHLQRLVNDLYELSMSDIGALTYRKIPVDPLGILKGTIDIFEQRLSDSGIELRSSLPEKISSSLLGDPDRLQQLFTNLLENSLRYTDMPGILEISAESTMQQLTISFQDSAPGVEKSQLALLFDRFFRTDPSRHRAGSGAGLGLAICTNIVEAHQGTISAQGSPHSGLGITIKLPLNS